MSLPMSALGRKGGNQMIADNLHDAGWILGWVSTIDSQGRTIWIVDAHGYGKRFVVRADEKLTAFLNLGTQRFVGQSNYDRDSNEMTGHPSIFIFF